MVIFNKSTGKLVIREGKETARKRKRVETEEADEEDELEGGS